MRALGKVRRGREGEEPQPFQFARKKRGSRPGVWEQEELWGPSRMPTSERLRGRGHGVTSGRRDTHLNDA